MRTRAYLSTLAALLLSAAPALAEEPPGGIRLAYIRGPGTETCPNEVDFRHIAAAYMDGVDPFTDKGAQRLTVRLDRHNGRFAGEAALEAPGQSPRVRRFENIALCRGLVAQLAAAISIMLLPPPSLPAPPPAPPPPRREGIPTQAPFQLPEEGKPPSSSQPAPPHVEQNESAAHHDTPSRTRHDGHPHAPGDTLAPQTMRPLLPISILTAATLTATPADAQTPPERERRPELSAGVLVPVGEMPGVSAGFSLGFGFRWPMASVNLEARGNVPKETDPDDWGRTLTTQVYVGSLVPCFHVSRFVGCGIATIGLARWTHPDGLADLNRTRIELGGRVGVDFPLGDRFAIQVTSDVVWIPDDHRVFLDYQMVYKVSPIAWLPGLRLVAAL